MRALGCVGKVANGIVTVHLAVARDTFKALLGVPAACRTNGRRDRSSDAASGPIHKSTAATAHRERSAAGRQLAQA
jgi:hypothetical protein